MTRHPTRALALCLSAFLAACGGGSAQDHSEPELSTKNAIGTQIASASSDASQPSMVSASEIEFWAKSAHLVQSEIHGKPATLSSSDIGTKVSGTNAAAIYRFYNINTGAHLFTRDVTERDRTLNTLPQFRYEGPVFSGWSASAADLSPVYRFYNASSGTHFFTISEAEKNSVLVTRPDMSLDGVAYYASTTAKTGTTALSRFLHLQKGFHFYTASAAERDAIIANLAGTYRYEGPAFYVNSTIETYRNALAPFVGKSNSYGNMNGFGSDARFGEIASLSFDSSGALYAIHNKVRPDTYLGLAEIKKVSTEAVATSFAGSWTAPTGYKDGIGSTASFDEVNALIFDANGTGYFGDSRTVRTISPTGSVVTIAGSLNSTGYINGLLQDARFLGIRGIARDKSGNLFVSECFYGAVYEPARIRKITPGGVVSTFAGAPPTATVNVGYVDAQGTTARFRCPRQMAIDDNDNLYVADQDNHVIRKISPSGLVTTFAGSGVAGIVDGVGTSAQFYHPRSIAIDKSTGNLYVADWDRFVVRKVTPGGVVTTVVGVNQTPGVFFGTLPAGLDSIGGLAVNQGRLYIASKYGIYWTNLP